MYCCRLIFDAIELRIQHPAPLFGHGLGVLGAKARKCEVGFIVARHVKRVLPGDRNIVNRVKRGVDARSTLRLRGISDGTIPDILDVMGDDSELVISCRNRRTAPSSRSDRPGRDEGVGRSPPLRGSRADGAGGRQGRTNIELVDRS